LLIEDDLRLSSALSAVLCSHSFNERNSYLSAT